MVHFRTAKIEYFFETEKETRIFFILPHFIRYFCAVYNVNLNINH